MEKKINSNEVENDFKELFPMLLGRIQWIILASIVCSILAFVISSLLVTPVYTSSTQIYVLSKTDASAMSFNDLQMSSQLAEDCTALIQSRTVTSQVIHNLNLNITDQELSRCIGIKEVSNSGRVLEITVTYPDAEMAQKIADNLREVSTEYFVEIMDLQAVNTVEEADFPQSPSSPSVKIFAALGFIGGFIVSAIIFIVLYMLNDKICTEDDVEKYHAISVLGSIPDSLHKNVHK